MSLTEENFIDIFKSGANNLFLIKHIIINKVKKIVYQGLYRIFFPQTLQYSF